MYWPFNNLFSDEPAEQIQNPPGEGTKTNEEADQTAVDGGDKAKS